MAMLGQQLREGTMQTYSHVATAGQTSFPCSYGVGSSSVSVFQNGVLLSGSDINLTSGNAAVLNVAAAVNDEITIQVQDVFSVADTVSAASGGTFTGNVQFDGSFTSKGIDDNADATAVTIDSSENVLVGKTSAGIANTGSEFSSTGRAFFTFDGGGPLQLNRKTSDGDIIELHKDGTEVGSIGAKGGDLFIGTGDTGIRFYDGGDAIIPTTTDGASSDNARDLGAATIRFKDLYLSGGAYLGGTGAANKLSDYETGTWTAALDGITIASQFCRYIKVGTLVHVGAQIAIPVTGSGNNAMIGGFPFTTLNSDASRAGIVVSWHNVPSSNGLQFLLSDNATAGFFYIGSSIKSYANMSGATVYFGGTYIAA